MFKKYLEAIYNDISSTIRIDDEDVLKVCRDIFRDDILMEWMVIWYNELLVLKFLLEDITLPYILHSLNLASWPDQHAKAFVFKIVVGKDPIIRTLQ